MERLTSFLYPLCYSIATCTVTSRSLSLPHLSMGSYGVFAGPLVNHEAILDLHSNSSCFAMGQGKL